MAYIGLFLAVALDNAVRLLVPEDTFFHGFLPGLPLITALYIGFRARDTGGLGLAVVLGLMADCFSARPLGHFAFLYGCAAYLALQVRRYVPTDAYVSHVVACLFCAVATSVLGLLLAVVTVDGPLGPGFARSLLAAVSSALLAPFAFAVWQKTRLFRRALGTRRLEFSG